MSIIDDIGELDGHIATLIEGNQSIPLLKAEIERLRQGYRDIKKATVEGSVCDDVAWFDCITTLYDFCDCMLGDDEQ